MVFSAEGASAPPQSPELMILQAAASVKSPMRSDFAATLKGLPPAMTSPALDRIWRSGHPGAPALRC